MTEGRLICERDGPVARVLFDHPGAHNALTHQMWLDLRDECTRLADRSRGPGRGVSRGGRQSVCVGNRYFGFRRIYLG